MIARIFHILAYSCRKAALLIEKKRIYGLTSIEKLRLKMHLNACVLCREYDNQNEIIHNSLRHHLHEDQTPCDHHLSEEDRKEIKEGVRKNTD